VTFVLPEQQRDVAQLAQRLGHAHELENAPSARKRQRRR
jgi:hypothetical protein